MEAIKDVLQSPDFRQLLRVVAREIALEIFELPACRRLIREVALRTIGEQERAAQVGAARSFLTACQARGIEVRLGQDGRIWATNYACMGPDLRAVFIVYREPILSLLRLERDCYQRAEPTNGIWDERTTP